MAADYDAEFVPIVCEVLGGIQDEATMLFKRITRLHTDETKPWLSGDAYQRLVQRFAVAIQVGNARIFDRVAQYNRIAGLQAPNPRHRIAAQRHRPARTPPHPSIRIEVDAQPPALGIVDAAGVPDHASLSRRVHITGRSSDEDLELPSTPEQTEPERTETEQSEPEQSEPDDDSFKPSDRDLEVFASYNVNWSDPVFPVDSDNDSGADDNDNCDSDTDDFDGFAREQRRDARAVEVAFDSQRRQARRRRRWGTRRRQRR